MKKDNNELMKENIKQDHNDVYQRKILYNELLNSYEHKVFLQKIEKEREKNYEEIKKEEYLDPKEKEKKEKKALMKLNELRNQIQEHEKKEKENRQRLTNLFQFEDKIKEIEQKKNNTKTDEQLNTYEMAQKKVEDLEEKFILQKYRREMALIKNMDRFQRKINVLTTKNEQKEEKIKLALIKAKEDREKILKKNNIFLDSTEKNLKHKQLIDNEKRKKLLENIEKKNLRSFVIINEKNNMVEEQKKKNKMRKEKSEYLKLRLNEIVKADNKIEGNKKISMINNLLTEFK